MTGTFADQLVGEITNYLDDREVDEDMAELGALMSAFHEIASFAAEDAGQTLPPYKADPNWFGGLYAETVDALGYKPSLTGAWSYDMPRWSA